MYAGVTGSRVKPLVKKDIEGKSILALLVVLFWLADFGLEVSYESNHKATVKVPDEYKNKMCGICGNFNDDPNDDMFPRNKNVKGSFTAIGNSWRVKDDTGDDNPK